MRLAIIIGSSYEKATNLPALPSSGIDVQFVADGLAEYDSGFSTMVLAPGKKLEAQLERVLDDCGDDNDVLFYFSGHVSVADGVADLLLDHRKGGRLAFGRAVELFKGRARAALVVIDAVHAPVPEDPAASAAVVAEIREAVAPKESGVGLLVAARSSDRPVPSGPSLFTRLWLQALEGARPAEPGGAVTAAEVFSAMRNDEERFLEIPASGYFGGARELAMSSGAQPGAPTSQPPSSDAAPMSERAPKKPKGRGSGSMKAVTDDAPVSSEEPPSSERAPMSDRAPKKPKSHRSGEMRAVQAPPKRVAGPPSVEAMIAEGDAHAREGRGDEAVRAYKKALMFIGAKRSPEKLVLYVKIGERKLEAGSSREALSNFDKALAIDPQHAGAFTASADLLREQQDYVGLERLHRRRLEAQKTEDERFETLRVIAAMWLDEANDLKKGAEVLDKALALRPDDPGALELLVGVQDRLGRHARAVATRRKLAQALEDPASRSAVLTDAARIVAEHLPNKADAVDLAREALEADASALGALEVAATQLGKKRRWRELVEVYESVLERTQDEQVAWDLAKKLGMLQRDELDDAEGACRAFELAIEKDESDVQLRYWLAELYQVSGDLEKAARQFQQAARFSPMSADVHRRALWLFEQQGRADAAWNACAALDYLGEADINESLVADAHRPEEQLAVTGGLTEEDWLEGLFHPERDDDVNAILATVAEPAIRLRLEQLGDAGQLPDLDPARREDPEASTTTLARTLAWTSRLLGIDVPDLYLEPAVEGDLVAMPAEKPTAVASRKLGSGLSLPELAFLWGRNLALHRSEHRIVVFFPTLREVAVLFLAALSLGEEQSDAVESLDGDAARFAEALRESLSEDDAALLRHAVSRFEPTRARRRVRRWAHAIQFACNRAGLVACGDVQLAADLIRRFPAQTETSEDDQIGDLLAYSISDAYGTLRDRIGVTVKG